MPTPPGFISHAEVLAARHALPMAQQPRSTPKRPPPLLLLAAAHTARFFELKRSVTEGLKARAAAPPDDIRTSRRRRAFVLWVDTRVGDVNRAFVGRFVTPPTIRSQVIVALDHGPELATVRQVHRAHDSNGRPTHPRLAALHSALRLATPADLDDAAAVEKHQADTLYALRNLTSDQLAWHRTAAANSANPAHLLSNAPSGYGAMALESFQFVRVIWQLNLGMLVIDYRAPHEATPFRPLLDVVFKAYKARVWMNYVGPLLHESS